MIPICSIMAALSCALLSVATSADEAVDVFRASCGVELASFKRTVSAIRRNGWSPAPEDERPELATLLRTGRAAVPPSSKMDVRTFARRIGRQRHYLVLSGLVLDGIPSNGCYMYNFDATRPPDLPAMTAWMRREPVIERALGIVAANWKDPREPKGGMAVRAAFTSRDSPLVATIGLAGAAWVATAVATPE